MNGAVLQAEGSDSHAGVPVHDEIQGKVFDEIIAVILETLTVEGVQQRVSCAISNTTTPVAKVVTIYFYYYGEINMMLKMF